MVEAASIGRDGFLGVPLLLNTRSTTRVIWQVPGAALRIPAAAFIELARDPVVTEVLLESSISPADRERIGRAVDRDLAQLERAFGHVFVNRPAVYVFATRSSFALGLQRIFGVRAATDGLSVAAILRCQHLLFLPSVVVAVWPPVLPAFVEAEELLGWQRSVGMVRHSSA